MIGAIAGDIIGSVYEARPIKRTDFQLFSRRSRFTDDTVLTTAAADCILHGGNYVDKYKEYFSYYPHAGYGGTFIHWAASPTKRDPYNSWGNGSAMRVSPVGFAFDSMEKVLAEAQRSAEVTHNHPEGIKGAQAVAAAVFLAKKGENKTSIKKYIEVTFGYNLKGSLSEIRKTYTFDVSCQGSVPQAIIAFLESENFEDAVRKAISLGGDSDTLACLAGAISQAYYKSIPQFIVETVYDKLDNRLGRITGEFTARYCKGLI
jgi:ADP-ribosylglycohydrolase